MKFVGILSGTSMEFVGILSSTLMASPVCEVLRGVPHPTLGGVVWVISPRQELLQLCEKAIQATGLCESLAS